MKKLMIRLVIVGVIMAIGVIIIVNSINNSDAHLAPYIALRELETNQQYISLKDGLYDIQVQEEGLFENEMRKQDFESYYMIQLALFDIYSYYLPYLQFASLGTKAEVAQLNSNLEVLKRVAYSEQDALLDLVNNYINVRETAPLPVRRNMFNQVMIKYGAFIDAYYDLSMSLKTYVSRYALQNIQPQTLKITVLNVQEMLIDISRAVIVSQIKTQQEYRRYPQLTHGYLALFVGSSITAEQEINTTQAFIKEVNDTLHLHKTHLNNFQEGLQNIDLAAYLQQVNSIETFATYRMTLEESKRDSLDKVHNYLNVHLPELFEVVASVPVGALIQLAVAIAG